MESEGTCDGVADSSSIDIAMEITESTDVSASTENLSDSSTSRVNSAENQKSSAYLRDVIEIVKKYGDFAEKFQFENARKCVDEVHAKWLNSADNTLPTVKCWLVLLSSLSQVSQCDRNYYLLAFLQPKVSFFKENSQRNPYNVICDELQKTIASVDETANGMSVVKHLLSQASAYVNARMLMVSVYVSMSTFVNDRNVTWDKILEQIEEALRILRHKCTHPAFSALSHLFAEEIEILLQLIKAQIWISDCQMFESLLQLKEVRERFDFWVKDADSPNNSSRRFFSFFRPSDRIPRNRLIQWLVQFYNLLMAKFSLYFNDVLENFCSHDDIKAIHTIDNGFNFMSNAKQFVMKTEALMFAIVMDRSASTDDFYGFGYHRLKQRFLPGKPPNPLQGVEASFPYLFRMFHEKYQDPQTNLEYSELVAQHFNRLFEDNTNFKNRYLVSKTEKEPLIIFGEFVESHVYVVAVYCDHRSEKDSAVTTFLRELSPKLRGSRLFSALKE